MEKLMKQKNKNVTNSLKIIEASNERFNEKMKKILKAI